MQKTKRNVTKENDLQRIKELRLMDDDFFSEALDGKTKAVEYILNTILERDDIKVKSTKAQVEYKSATKRSIKLDIQAEDVHGRLHGYRNTAFRQGFRSKEGKVSQQHDRPDTAQ